MTATTSEGPTSPAGSAIATPGPSEAPIVPDRYPAALVGRLFLLAGSDPRDLTLGRIGLPGRLTLGPGTTYLASAGDRVVTSSTTGTGGELRLWSIEGGGAIEEPVELHADDRFLAVVGDRLVTVASSATASVLRVWSFASGTELGHGTAVSAIPQPAAQVAGSDVLVGSSMDEGGHDPGLVSISTTDGSIRIVAGPTSVAGSTPASRVTVISESGTELATAVCLTSVDAVGGCRPTAILDATSGRTVATLDLGGRAPALLADTWLLDGDIGGDELVDLEGRRLWSTAALGSGATAWATLLAPDGRLVVEIRSLSGTITPRILAVDPSSGRQVTLYAPGGSLEWHAWPALSTASLMAIGIDDFAPPCMTEACGPDDLRVADAATLDLATGELVAHAIHIAFAP